MTNAAAESLVIDFLERKIGLDSRTVGRGTVLAAVNARCAATKQLVVDYATFVQDNRDEQQALINEVIVPETWFFRDGTPFSHLAEYARRAIKTPTWNESVNAGEIGRPGRIAVLSVPCSTGEEPYSVAMALLNAGFDPSQFLIDAVDICDRSIAAARQGRFRSSSFRGTDLRYRDQFFNQAIDAGIGGLAWQIKEEVQRSIVFHCTNIFGMRFSADGGSRHGGPYDIVLCRNLLIYLTPKARQQALDILLGLMSNGALVVGGHAENLQVMDQRLLSTGATQAFSYVRRGDVIHQQLAGPTRSGPENAGKLGSALAGPERTVVKGSVSIAARSLTPVADATSDLLEQARQLADQGDLVAAAKICAEYLLRSATNPTGWILLGTIRQAQQDLAAAEQCFARAVYCDPTCYQALMTLAMLLERRGDVTGAANMKRRAAKASESAP